MKVLAIGDLHYSVDSLTYMSKLEKSIHDLIDERRPDLLILMGDTLDKSTSKVDVQVAAVKFISSLVDKLPVRLIIGNHDLPYKDSFFCETHAFVALKGWNNILVIDKTETEVIEGIRITYVPYVDEGRMIEALDIISEWGQSKIVFGHNEVKGCDLGGIKSENGSVWEDRYPLVVMGHVHHYHRPQSNVWFIGTPRMVSASENKDKTVSMLTVENDSEVVEERISLGLPSLLKFDIHVSQVETFELPENSMSKLVIRGATSEIITVKKSRKIKLWKDMGAKIRFKYSNDKHVVNSLVCKPMSERLTYRQELKKEISNDEHMTQLFNEMF